jgi:hypothetical protein
MKKIFGVILVLVVLVFCVWLVLRRPTELAEPTIVTPIPFQPTNIIVVISNAPSSRPAPAATTDTLVRPDSIAEEQWNRLMLIRQLALEENQPVQF